MQLDALIDRAGLPAGQVLSQLTLLELRGVVRRDPGKFYALI
jgi:DNA processing protein